jgi:hypothetical protein
MLGATSILTREILMNDSNHLKAYLDKAIGYVISDIDHLKSNNVTVSFPYLFLSFAGIEFLGGLQHGFSRSNSRFRSAWFIATWMSKVNIQYAKGYQEEKRSLASYLYAFARSGLIHMACVQRSVNVDASDTNRTFHLHYSAIKDSTVFFHAVQFAEDFLQAYDMFLTELFSDEAKVHAAIEHLDAYVSSSVTQESSYSISSLFIPLPDPILSSPPSFSTVSVSPLSLGTQAPPFRSPR